VLFIPNGVIEYLTLRRKFTFNSIRASLAQTRV